MPLRHFKNEAFLLDSDLRCGEYFDAIRFVNGATIPFPKGKAEGIKHTKGYRNINAVRRESLMNTMKIPSKYKRKGIKYGYYKQAAWLGT